MRRFLTDRSGNAEEGRSRAFFCMILGPHANPELFRIRMERKVPGVLKFFYYI